LRFSPCEGDAAAQLALSLGRPSNGGPALLTAGTAVDDLSFEFELKSRLAGLSRSVVIFE
jgi:hypothetical protein